MGHQDSVRRRMKNNVANLESEAMKSPEAFAPSGTYPVTYDGSAVTKGASFRITGDGAVGAVTVNPEDLLIALVNAPGQTDASWQVVESNRDQATETVKGVARLATAAEITAGANAIAIVTPIDLQQKIDAIPSDWWNPGTPNSRAERNFTLAQDAVSQQQTLGVDMNPTPLTACMLLVKVEMMALRGATMYQQTWQIAIFFDNADDTPENRLIDSTIFVQSADDGGGTNDVKLADLLALSGGGGGELEVGFTDVPGSSGSYNVYLKSVVSEPKATP